MTRDRSKSIVKRIASDVPSYNDDKLNLGETSGNQSSAEVIKADKPKRYRSKSFSLDKANRDIVEDDFHLFPFSKREHEYLWSKYINTYNYNSILNPDEIMKVNNISNDFILNFQSNCQLNIENINDLMDETETILKSLNLLALQYDKVSSETSEFADQSTKLLNTQLKYERASEEISESLEIFESLERITKALTSPGNNLIKRKSFQDILNKLDKSIEFIDKHPQFKDIELYKVRFRQCMTRSLTLIRNYLINELKTLHDGIYSKLNRSNSEEAARNVTIDILLYNEFNNYITENEGQFYNFPNLVNEITKRIEYHDEYKGLLHDVLQQYFKTRSKLLEKSIWDHINTSAKNSTKDLVQFSQDNISFFKKIIDREFLTFTKYFHNSESLSMPSFMNSELYNWFMDIIDPLYDTLRNRIIRETNITTLCQLTTLLQKYYEFEDDESVAVLQENQINYGSLFETILQDVQSRLIFRIQIYIDEKLIKYKPKPEDLKIGNRKRSSTINNESVVEENPLDIDYNENLFKDLYLPLGKALTILSNIYELINSVVFDDLAHYIVHSCIYILKNGAYKISLTHLGKLDSKLYYLKNLIILQNQLNNFDIQYVRTETTLDFTSGINEIFQTFRNGEFIYNYNQNGGFIELVKKSAPKVINNMIDAKYEIELELNNAVHEFITECANIISEPILSKTSKEEPLQKSLSFRDNLMTDLPKFHKEVKFFINEVNIIKYLIDNLCNLVITTYENFYHLLEEEVQHNEKLKHYMQEIMEVDTLIGFITDIVSGLYESDEISPPRIEFNEDILNDTEMNVSE
ncbi:DEHA2C02640p [Debaryomyces hansenii CBS767]|uniref:Conserved oligomeric Golgi complex subunit 3 n=1 Tax=Debaryomyces hansenii (strain ATCC 36239 / CBS 767 / BCRC 21394 / JCM 1990 / NBRC 0083 / IGC 2968) TaxID=284592 RepID=Q6BVH5_DEBHA|nr:DEHA2C02640p [Debaryomyces hansenii CBS767]CAG85834.2 DEHA2C02640p [Debaryomyces hansenii CBS767]|eukprot:XP_457794.2 DEHA2C02640p [Debaryomyces hansenii CBS767]